MPAGPLPRADTPALQERGLARRPSGQKGLLDLNQRSEDPWRDLFLWAVLQNRHEMATYFWAMVRRAEGAWGSRGAGRTPGGTLEGPTGGRGGLGWAGRTLGEACGGWEVAAHLGPVSQGQEGVAAALAACQLLFL